MTLKLKKKPFAMKSILKLPKIVFTIPTGMKNLTKDRKIVGVTKINTTPILKFCEGKKPLSEKEKMLVTSIFSFSHYVFKGSLKVPIAANTKFIYKIQINPIHTIFKNFENK